MAGELSHDVRVLACGYCGAPNSVPVQGGFVQCGHCRATMEVALRREESLARSGEGELDRIHRVSVLRAQDGRPLLVPDSVKPYFAVGGLAPGRMEAALEAWRAALLDLRQRYAREPEERLYFLTRLLSDRLWTHERHLEARALLESAAEVLRARRHRQITYCMLARRAAVLGDLAAADAWLGPCDPASYDLHMDSELRMARAFIATMRGDFEAVIAELAASAKDHPFADSCDALIHMYRAHALEHTKGADSAVEGLVEACEKDPTLILDLQDIRAGAPIDLCPQSFPLTSQRQPMMNRVLGCGPIGCSTLFLAVEVPMILNVLLWKDVWFDSPTATWVVPLVLGVLLTPFLALWGWVHFKLAQKRAERRRAREGGRR